MSNFSASLPDDVEFRYYRLPWYHVREMRNIVKVLLAQWLNGESLELGKSEIEILFDFVYFSSNGYAKRNKKSSSCIHD